MAAAGQVHSRLADYEVGGVISKGSFGVVYKAVRKSDGRVFALKQVNLKDMKRAERQEAIDEARMLSQLDHPHVVKHYDSFIDAEDRLNILMEYASKGNLASMIKAYKGKPMPEDLVWRVLIQSLLGLNHIHLKKIIHRDVKALNLFIDAHDNIKIGDLGIARALSDNSSFARSIVGTPYYLSPELCEDKPYGVKSDIWALGVVLYEACMGRYPFDAQNEGALIRKILRGQFDPVKGPYSSSLVQIIASCLTFKPEARPDSTALLRNPALVAKAKALGLSLNPQASAALEDAPVYEVPAAQSAYPPQPHPFDQASPSGAAYPYPYPAAPQQQQYPGQQYPAGAAAYYQQGGGAYQAGGAAAAAAAGPGPGYSPNHQQQYSPAAGGYQQPPGARGGAAPAGRADPAHPFALQGQGGVAAFPRPHSAYGGAGPHPQQQQQQQPYVPYDGKDPHNPWDRMAVDVNKMQLRESELARHNADRVQRGQANVHAGRRDNLKELMYNGPQDSGPRQQRLQPEALPAAGGRPASGNGGAPFATYGPALQGYETMNQAQHNEAWKASYERPQYGRRRCPELQITGPSLRSTSARGGGGGGYAPAADDATSYATTSYATTYHQR